ncbi:MAG: GPI anchored serine-threonine rich family protein [Blastocatellia bacterium]|nr:GPI anchored serine-threonine rich family protein [Blastocatellia bacterium]
MFHRLCVGLGLVCLLAGIFPGIAAMQEISTEQAGRADTRPSRRHESEIWLKNQTVSLRHVAPERVVALRDFRLRKAETADGSETIPLGLGVEPQQQAVEYIRNGGFESGKTSWVFDGGIISSIARTGTSSAALGLINNAFDEVQQTVSLPSGAGPTQLSCYINLISDEPASSTRDDDLFGIQILDTTGKVLETVDAWSNRDQQRIGTFTLRGPYNLAAYRGRTVVVSFVGINDALLPSTMRVDDVSLKVTSTSQGDFDLMISPASQTVQAGEAASYVLGINASGQVGNVTISAQNLPPATRFESNYGNFPFPFRIVTSPTTPPGTYSFIVTGEIPGIRRSTSATLVVTQPVTADFSLAVTPASQTVRAGQSATYTLNRTNQGGFSSVVSVEATNLPPGCRWQIPAEFQFPVNFQLVTSGTTPPGTYSFTIQGEGGNLRRSASASLTVQPGDITAPIVRVVAPNGGEKLKWGSSFTISWESSDNEALARHDLLLALDGVNYSTTVVTGLSGAARSFTYAIPATLPKAKAAKIRVIALDAVGNAAQDESDGGVKVK